MRFGVCAKLNSLVRGSLGLDYVESTVQDALCPLEGEDAFASRLEAARSSPAPVEGLNLFLPPDLKCAGPDVDQWRLDRYVATVLSRAARAGVKVIAFGSGGSRRRPDGFDRMAAVEQIVAHLKRWGPLAASAGIVIALEPLRGAETNTVNTLAEGADVVRRAGSPGIRLLADTYHMCEEGETPEAIRQAAELIAHVHCAEVAGRGPLGAAGEDLRPFFRALKEAGYNRRISIEAAWTDFGSQLPGAMEELRRQWESA